MTERVYECFSCGDGIHFDGEWEHINDSIGVDGKRVISTCTWAKPWQPKPNECSRFGGHVCYLPDNHSGPHVCGELSNQKPCRSKWRDGQEIRLPKPRVHDKPRPWLAS